MGGATRIGLDLSKDDFIQIYKACLDRQAKLDRLQQESDDEDVAADAGNDLLEINMVIRDLKAKADQNWGEKGWTASDKVALITQALQRCNTTPNRFALPNCRMCRRI